MPPGDLNLNLWNWATCLYFVFLTHWHYYCRKLLKIKQYESKNDLG
ncbi:MAG: hypothetical protein K0Q79_1919 [Flavipsychrobacter sp.]|jgi:hypothetical protein|nr:hypothetical protein [Flavipsychrobacter sp.]